MNLIGARLKSGSNFPYGDLIVRKLNTTIDGVNNEKFK